MGCWYESCAVTHLPILPEEHVVMVVIGNDFFTRNGKKVYNMRPRRLEFNDCWNHIDKIETGKYNEYGWLEGLPGDHSKNMIDRVEKHLLEPYERAFFVKNAVWEKILSLPVHNNIFHSHVSDFKKSFIYDEPPEESLLLKIKDLIKVLCFCENCRIDFLAGWSYKGSQNRDLEPYRQLMDIQKTALYQLVEREEKLAQE